MLLIDEVDRADEALEAVLLELLAEFQISMPEIGTFTAVSQPYVLLTSNNTRDLSSALKRRCLHLTLEYPGRERELDIIASKHTGPGRRRWCAAWSTSLHELRDLDLRKSPSISEAVDWARTLAVLNAETLDPALLSRTISVVLKYEKDVGTALCKVRALHDPNRGRAGRSPVRWGRTTTVTGSTSTATHGPRAAPRPRPRRPRRAPGTPARRPAAAPGRRPRTDEGAPPGRRRTAPAGTATTTAAAPPSTSASDVDETVLRFASVLRERGVRLSVAEVEDAARAVAAVGLTRRDPVRLALEAALVKEARDLPVFDELFELFFRLRPVTRRTGRARPRPRARRPAGHRASCTTSRCRSSPARSRRPGTPTTSRSTSGSTSTRRTWRRRTTCTRRRTRSTSRR